MAIAMEQGDGFSRRWHHNGEEWLYELTTLNCVARARTYRQALIQLADQLREKGYHP